MTTTGDNQRKPPTEDIESNSIDDPKLSNNQSSAPPTTTKGRAFPNIFYCPITGVVMTDPVVLKSDGHSYERQAISNRDDPPLLEHLYPNRALLSIIEERQAERRSILKRVQVSMRSTMSLLAETASLSSSSRRHQQPLSTIPTAAVAAQQ